MYYFPDSVLTDSVVTDSVVLGGVVVVPGGSNALGGLLGPYRYS